LFIVNDVVVVVDVVLVMLQFLMLQFILLLLFVEQDIASTHIALGTVLFVSCCS
jgi:hypothetical protein